MSVVKLNGHLLWNLVPVSIGTPKTADQIRQRTGDQKVLLHEAQALAKACRVIRIENSSERFRDEGLGNGANEITMAENFEVEVIGGRRRPESKRVDGLA